MHEWLRPAVFLDRDGTLIVDRHYLADPAGVELLPGAGAAVARLNRAGLAVVLATNQSGIGRGYFTEADYRAVHARLEELLAGHGARFDAAYVAPAADEAPGPEDDRKPGVGMFRRAAREHGLDLAASFYVGDRLRDVAPAERLGGTPILVRSPESELAEAGARGVPVVASLAEAVERILGEKRLD
ncbi:MAG TPA: HAD family hydrolase [Longimicrobiaceae bacterium]|nr:HAD family hydrolase [Longimicrobiaceae bacterium]